MMTDTNTGPAAAYLAEVQADWDRIGGKPVRHVPRLVAALEAALGLTGEWRKDAADLDQRAGKAADEGDHTRSALLSYRAQAHTDCALGLERAIAAKLLGEGSG